VSLITRGLRCTGGFAIAAAVLASRFACRIQWHNDPRPTLRRQGHSYLYSVLHAHQFCAIMYSEWRTGAMLSASADGEILLPALRTRGVVAYRGSTRKRGQDKGGREALAGLARHVQGGAPAYLAVDGPRGPRGHVHRGIANLARETGAPVLPLCLVPSRRWILRRAWDRFQIPAPFASVDGYFGEPLWFGAGDDVEAFRQRIERELAALEQRHDALEAEAGGLAAVGQRARLARLASEARGVG